MKKIFVWLLLYTGIVATACSQKLNIPVAVNKAFSSKYPGATNLKWGKENAKEYEAEFKLDGTTVSANFDSDGNWVETETVMKVADLPAVVTDAITKKYPGASIIIAEKLEQPGNKVLFETTIKMKDKKKTVELNPDGTFAK